MRQIYCSSQRGAHNVRFFRYVSSRRIGPLHNEYKQVFDSAIEHLMSIDTLPTRKKQCTVEQMKALVESEHLLDVSGSHAAICVAECYAIRFGVTLDKTEVVNWVYKAVELGSQRAMSWLCFAMGLEPVWSDNTSQSLHFDQELNLSTTEAYLGSRIKLQRDYHRAAQELCVEFTK